MGRATFLRPRAGRTSGVRALSSLGILPALGLLVACSPGLPSPQAAAPGQPCSQIGASLHPVPLNRVLDVAAVEAAVAGIEDPGEAHFSLWLRNPNSDEPRQTELAPTTISEPVLVLGGTLEEEVAAELADALAEVRGLWVEGELPSRVRVTLRSGAVDAETPRIQVEPSEGCSPMLADRQRLSRALDGVTRESRTQELSTSATMLVDATGRVVVIRFDEAGERFHGRVLLEQLLRTTPFHPGIRDGIPVSAWVTLPIELRAR
jgi:hypothetical protein